MSTQLSLPIFLPKSLLAQMVFNMAIDRTWAPGSHVHNSKQTIKNYNDKLRKHTSSLLGNLQLANITYVDFEIWGPDLSISSPETSIFIFKVLCVITTLIVA